MPSIPQSNKTFYPNMDLVRYLLSLGVVFAHLGLAGHKVPFPISSFESVGGFFALSGFLMYPNYIRHNSFKKYTLQRCRRILPPYTFIIILCAVGFAGITSLSLTEYFTSPTFWKYLIANLSFLNWLQPSLPGVFEGAQYTMPAVNGSLWTMKVEWSLYFSVPLFVLIVRKLPRIDKTWAAVVTIILSIAYRYFFEYLHATTGREIYHILSYQIFGQLAYFYCGMLICFFKDKFVRHLPGATIIGLVLYFCGLYIPVTGNATSPFAISILVMVLSLIPRDLGFLRHRNNISYEIYLFHWPIIQLSIYLGISKSDTLTELGFVLALNCALAYAFHSVYEHIRSGAKYH